ncbi:MAG: bifunctional hydroxymethylpyrimidine kinase/phosphomethylpyrimidine kinase [Candidatus Cloacimonetes bacterium]|nr:bifunctional hydroxymethylpyrimidine kinase/phosphomethylpyrimidine kinase [Candidatus Cloacimonadota bacterium]
MKNIALTIAGSDSCSGAGIQADLKTFAAHNIYGLSIITSVTSQNSKEVSRIYNLPVSEVEKQFLTLLEDFKIDGIKIGMLGSYKISEVIIEIIKSNAFKHIVLDPVILSSSGHRLLETDGVKLIQKYLFPICSLITPNIQEAEILTGLKITNQSQMVEACRLLAESTGTSILLKGGHLPDSATDLLYDNGNFFFYRDERINHEVHGTGCTFSSAICSELINGKTMNQAVESAKKYISECILNSVNFGSGSRLINHLFNKI